MALESYISQADTASPTRRAAVQREIQRRVRYTRLGTGAGSDLVDMSVVPVCLSAMELEADAVTRVYRYLDRKAQDVDERVQLLHVLLGE
ncbi:MAG TPA: hypothetical protein VFU47_09050 [Armatimonadota bacterium]|nr:hypothetical protein [Armatimonadota bacterium]